MQDETPRVIDAEFEVISGARPETFGEKSQREYQELGLVGRVVYWVLFIGLMVPIILGAQWLTRTLFAAIGWGE